MFETGKKSFGVQKMLGYLMRRNYIKGTFIVTGYLALGIEFFLLRYFV